MTSAVRFASLLVLALGPTGCAPPEATHAGTGVLGADESSLLSGTYTYEHPEVGLVFAAGRAGSATCTGTLVGTRLVLTASHCMGFGAGDVGEEPDHYGRFEIRATPGASRAFVIRRFQVYSEDEFGPGPDDVALLELAEDVPAALAAPVRIARAEPRALSRATLYGYGCQSRRSAAGLLEKQTFSFLWGRATGNLCPGDSGGPTITDRNEIACVNSGFRNTGRDIFGLVYSRASDIEATAARWGHALASGESQPAACRTCVAGGGGRACAAVCEEGACRTCVASGGGAACLAQCEETSCLTCVANGGGRACAGACEEGACRTCVASGGGTACLSRCGQP